MRWSSSALEDHDPYRPIMLVGELQKMKRKKRACGTASDYAHGAPILQLIRW
jgi:hypothetical protein